MSSIGELSLTELRRDLHKHPEAGWTEFRTTALVADELEKLGYTLYLGDSAVNVDTRLGVPDEDDIQRARDRAQEDGAPESYLDRMGSITGLVATKTFGDGSGPVVGVRVDIDALEMTESSGPDHRPANDGFASVHPTEMHACGHDGHTAIGVGTARKLNDFTEFDGTVKLFFQPAEEGGRGGLPMSKTPHLDNIDYFLALHLGLDNETGKVIAGYDRPLSNAKLNVEFEGESAHAGKVPNQGKNALQAATTAIQNLYSIPRHEAGATRINVGKVHSPNAQNVISDKTNLRIEVRGETADLNEYMLERARHIVEHAAGMYEVEYQTGLYGKTTTFRADDGIVNSVFEAVQSLDAVTNPVERAQIGASEDASYLIKRVQDNGGEGTYIGIGASNVSGHHTSEFDFDEEAIEIGVDTIVSTIGTLSSSAND